MEISRDGSRSTSARTVSLTDAVQALTAAATQRGGTPAAPVTNLPRDPLDLSPFGPLAPLLIAAINPPREDTGRPEPRVWDYPAGFNLPGGGERLIPWETLRATSTNVDIIRRCIEIRKDDVRALKWSWAVSEDAIKAAMEEGGNKAREDVEADLRKRFAPDIARLTTFWKTPWITNGVRFGQWVARILEDHIVCDGVAIYPVTTVGGQVIAFRIVDAATVKLLINAEGERPQPPFPAFQQEVQGFPRGEFVADVVLNEDGTEDLSGTWTASQLTYWRENLRPDSPYGYSQVEQSLVSAALYLKRQGWMHAEYDSGSTPMTWLVPQGDKFVASQLGPQQRREYELAINDDLEGQTGARHRVKISYPGFEPKQMDTEAERYKPEYDRFLVNMVIGHMGVTMDRFGLTETKGLGATGQHERQAEVQDDSGVNPDAEMLQDIVMELSRNYLDAPAELCFVLTKDKAKDDAAEDAVADVQIKRGSLTLNEDRRRIGRPTFDFPEADMPAFYGASGPVYIEGGLERAQAAQDQAAALADAKANPPEPGGGPGMQGGGGTGGPAKPTPKPAAAPTRNKAAIASEVRAFGRWIDKTAHPVRPFRFEHADPADVWEAGWTLDPGVMAFEGFEWVADPIEKSRRSGMDWRAWNAGHPLHPRGPHGRFVRAAGLVDELKRIHGDLGEMHENALDEAARRAHAGRHFKRGDSQLADELERRGFLEEYGGKGGNGNKLEVSEAGRRHLQSRPDVEAPAVAPKIPRQRTPEPEAPKPEAPKPAKLDPAAVQAANRAYGDGDHQWREAAADLAAHGVAKRGNAAELAQSKDARAELVGEILDDIAPKADREAMAPKVDRAVEAAARSLADDAAARERLRARYAENAPVKLPTHEEEAARVEAERAPGTPARSEVAELHRAAEAADLEAHKAKVKREAVDRRPAITRADFNRKVKDARQLDEEALKHQAKARKHREAADKLRAQGATPEDRATIGELGRMAAEAKAQGRHEDAARAFEARAARLRAGESGWQLNPPNSKGESVLSGENSGTFQGFPSRKQAEQWRAEADATTAGIAEREAAQQRKLAAVKTSTSDGLPTDDSGSVEGMTTPTEPKAPKRLPDAQHNALMTIAAKRAEHAQREDAHRTVAPTEHQMGLTRYTTTSALARSGHIERHDVGAGTASMLTPEGHAYVAEHTGDTERAALVRELADVRAQRAALAADSASRPVNDDYGRYDTYAARLRQLNNEQDKPLYGREHQILRDLERKPVMTEEDHRIAQATAKADAAHEEWQAAQDRFNAATDAAYMADSEDPELNAKADAALAEEKAARDRYVAAEDELHRAGEPKRRREQAARDAEHQAAVERQQAELKAKARAEADAKEQAEANRARRAAEDEARQAKIREMVREMTPQVYAKLLDEPGKMKLTHEPSRKILAQMREQGWGGVSQQGSVSIWEAPDGRRMGIYRDTAKGGLAFQDERGYILTQKDAAALVGRSEPSAPSGPGYDAHAVGQLLDAATSREDAAKAIDDMNLTAPQLRALAGNLGVTVRASDSKTKVRDAIVGIKVGRRLDSRAVHPDKAHEAPSAKQLHPATPEGVRAAYADVLAEQGTAPSDTSWVSIADLRDRMGGTRDEQDAALREIEQHRDVNIVPQANQKVTSERTRAAAVRIGGQDKTHLVIDPNAEAEAARDEARLREIEAREAAQARSKVEAPAAEPAPRIVATPDAAPEPTGHGASGTPDAVAAPGEARKIPSRSGPAKRGDVMVVEKQGALSSYRSSDEEKARKSYSVYEVTGVGQDGAPKMLRELTHSDPGDKGYQVRMAMLHSTGKTHLIPGDQIDVHALSGALRANTYPDHPLSPRDYESLPELGKVLRGALRPEGYKPERKAKAEPLAPLDTTRVHIPANLTDEQRAKFVPTAEKIDAANAALLAQPYEGPSLRGDAAVQKVKAARELVAQARDAGMIVAVRHSEASGGAPYFDIQAVNPHTGEAFTATWHTAKGKDGSYGFMHGSINDPHRRGRQDAGPKAISDFMARSGERQAAREAEQAAEAEAARIAADPRTPKQLTAAEVQEGDWRWNPITGWEHIAKIGEQRGSRVLYSDNFETRIGTLPTDGYVAGNSRHWIVRHPDRPTQPPPGEKMPTTNKAAGSGEGKA